MLQQQKPSVKPKTGSPPVLATVPTKGWGGWGQWFLDRSVGQKHLIAFTVSQVLTLGGVLLLSSIQVRSVVQQEIGRGVTSGNVVNRINYNLQMNHMGFGFRSQADNAAIVEAAALAAQGKPVPGALEAQVRDILRRDTQRREIEYATLVGLDRRIVANAHANRRGEVFDPSGLVSVVLQNPQQVRASAIVTRSEMEKEGVALPPAWTSPEGLIRYVVTPVFAPRTRQLLGVLVAGDLVSGKPTIPENTVNSLAGGYSAVYFRDSQGHLVLATSRKRAMTGEGWQDNLAVPNLELIEAALRNPQQPVTGRQNIGDEVLVLSAQAEPTLFRLGDEGLVAVAERPPLVVLVLGTPTLLEQELLGGLLWQNVLVGVLALGVIGFWVVVLQRTVVRRIENLTHVTQALAAGNDDIRAEDTAADEVGQLGATFNEMTDRISLSQSHLQRAVRRNELLVMMARAQTNEDLALPLREFLEEVRQRLDCDRVVVYRLTPYSATRTDGLVVGEAGLSHLPSAMAAGLSDPCIPPAMLEAYRRGQVMQYPDLLQAELSPEHADLMRRLQIRANVIVPVIRGEVLDGLLIAHDTQRPRTWSEAEIELMRTYAGQLALVLVGLASLDQQRLVAQQEQTRSQELQRELLQLLGDVEGAASGDLTVRAQITAGEIGIVADFFNAIVENLRDVVARVKTTAAAVNESVTVNNTAIRNLAAEATQQMRQLEETLASVQTMAASLREAAGNARRAAELSRKAATKAETGQAAIEESTDTIRQLRQTVAETAKKVKRLGEALQQISKVVVLIDQVALKTNLLAVNASIEAARAGEEGRGFAVVAEEVGALASQSTAATQEIERIVETIQRETAEVVSAMEASTAQVVAGTEQVEGVRQSLADIVQTARQVNELFQAVSQATIAQVQTSQRVKRLMEQLTLQSQQASQVSQEVATALQATVGTANELQASVATFKVG